MYAAIVFLGRCCFQGLMYSRMGLVGIFLHNMPARPVSWCQREAKQGSSTHTPRGIHKLLTSNVYVNFVHLFWFRLFDTIFAVFSWFPFSVCCAL